MRTLHERFPLRRLDRITGLPARVLFDKHLSPEQLEEIPLEKRIKVLQDYSEPVKFGRSYWYILAFPEDSALLLSQDILMEHVEYKDIDAQLETFCNENFTDREKQCMADEPHAAAVSGL